MSDLTPLPLHPLLHRGKSMGEESGEWLIGRQSSVLTLDEWVDHWEICLKKTDRKKGTEYIRTRRILVSEIPYIWQPKSEARQGMKNRTSDFRTHSMCGERPSLVRILRLYLHVGALGWILRSPEALLGNKVLGAWFVGACRSGMLGIWWDVFVWWIYCQLEFGEKIVVSMLFGLCEVCWDGNGTAGNSHMFGILMSMAISQSSLLVLPAFLKKGQSALLCIYLRKDRVLYLKVSREVCSLISHLSIPLKLCHLMGCSERIFL